MKNYRGLYWHFVDRAWCTQYKGSDLKEDIAKVCNYTNSCILDTTVPAENFTREYVYVAVWIPSLASARAFALSPPQVPFGSFSLPDLSDRSFPAWEASVVVDQLRTFATQQLHTNVTSVSSCKCVFMLTGVHEMHAPQLQLHVSYWPLTPTYLSDHSSRSWQFASEVWS